jgi:uncharacterized spore protein YtfJ
MEKNNLRATEIFNDSRLMLVTIESVTNSHDQTGLTYSLYGMIEPVAVIACTLDGVYALDMKSNMIAIDQLKQDIPELDAMIARFNRADFHDRMT